MTARSQAENAGCFDFSIRRIASDMRYMLLRTLSTRLGGTALIDPAAVTCRATVSVSCFTAGSVAGVICRVRTYVSTSARGPADAGEPGAYLANTADA